MLSKPTRLPARAIAALFVGAAIVACGREAPPAAETAVPEPIDQAAAEDGAAATSGADTGHGATTPSEYEGDMPGPIVAVVRPAPPMWLDQARADQLATATEIGVLHDFGFTDQYPTSGITFRGYATPDASIDFKANHYDHGNGIAVADVDGDGLLDVYFVSQFGRNALYRNVGGGRFEELADAGVAFAGRVAASATFGDIDNDGDPDLYTTSVRFGNALFENDGTGRFTDITESAGLTYFGHSSSTTMFDYDNDGLLDILLVNIGRFTTEQRVAAPIDLFRPDPSATNEYYVGATDAFSAQLDPARGESSVLYRNEGGNVFRDVTVEAGLVDTSWSGAATAIDANDDGWQDLYILNMQGHDQYYENQGGQSFVRRTEDIFPRTPWGAMGAKVFDYNNDGRLDLWVTDMHSDMAENMPRSQDKRKANVTWPEELSRSEGRSIWGNAFFRKEADGSYVETGDAIGAETYWPWGLSVGDLNADGYDDAFIASSMNFHWRYAPNAVMLNDRGEAFHDAEFIVGVEPRRDGAAYQPWYSLDCSGDNWDHPVCVDLSLSGKVDVWEPKGTRSSAIFDIDGDGDLDIITNEWNGEPQVLVNDLTVGHAVNHLSVSLEGTGSNRDGLGARVTAEAGDDRYVKVNDGSSGYLSQSVMPLYFGLGDHAAADRLTVRWPSGVEQVVEGPLTGAVQVIEQGG